MGYATPGRKPVPGPSLGSWLCRHVNDSGYLHGACDCDVKEGGWVVVTAVKIGLCVEYGRLVDRWWDGKEIVNVMVECLCKRRPSRLIACARDSECGMRTTSELCRIVTRYLN